MIDQQGLTAYFADRLGSQVEVTRFKRTFPGISRETYLVWTKEGGAEGGYVFRTDAPGGPICPEPLEFEYKVMKGLFGTAVPVAEPLWYDHAPAITDGRPVMVRALADGSNAIPGLYDEGADAEARRQRIAFEHAEKLAALHTLDWQGLGFGEFMNTPASPEQCARTDFDYWMRMRAQTKTDPMPLLTEAAFWLEEHLPKTAPRVSLGKGNNGMGEEIWKDDKLVALSDWELAFLGDPAQDWALSQGMLSMGDGAKTLKHYAQHTGFEIDPYNLKFYRVWEVWRTSVTLQNGLGPFISGVDTKLGRLTLGLGRSKLLEQLIGMVIGKSIEEAEQIIDQWRKSPYRMEGKAA